MSKFQRKPLQRQTATATTTVAPPPEILSEPPLTEASTTEVSELSDSELRALFRRVREETSRRKQSALERAPRVDQRVSWQRRTRAGLCTLTGAVACVKGTRVFVKTPDSIEIVRLADIRVCDAEGDSLE